MNDELKTTLPGLFMKAFSVFAERPAITFDNQTLTYKELSVDVYRCANSLSDLGVSEGTPVSLFLPNSVEYVSALLGVWCAGGARVALNHMLGPDDVEFILRDSCSPILIVHASYLAPIHKRLKAIETLRYIVVVESEEHVDGTLGWQEFLNASDPKPIGSKVSSCSMASLAYTGGTTGRSKGVISSHQGSFFTTLSVILEEDVVESDCMLLITPLPHASGLRMMAGLAKGAHIVIENKFDESKTLDLIDRHCVTFLHLVPTMIYRLIDYMTLSGRRVKGIQTIAYGTSPIAPSRLEEALDLFGPVFVQSYGMTESPGLATRLTKTDHAEGLASVNRLSSCGTETLFSNVRIVDENLREVPSGQSGEIIIQSYTNMAGYHGLPELTRETLIDGWLRTGDVGMKDDDGYLFLLDRKKDMIITGGLNVYSAEVENAVHRAPGVKQVAVIGTPDDDWGEMVTAVVVPDDDFSESGFTAYCKEHLTGYKRPKKLITVPSFPLTNYGKIDKKALREPFWSEKKRNIG